jgi:hypothetical protein
VYLQCLTKEFELSVVKGSHCELTRGVTWSGQLVGRIPDIEIQCRKMDWRDERQGQEAR